MDAKEYEISKLDGVFQGQVPVSYTHLYRAKTRFAKFYNLPELMAAFKEVADIQTADMLKLPVPKANFHTEVIQPSEFQKEMILSLIHI